MTTKTFERNRVTRRFSMFPEDFAPALKNLLRLLNDDETAVSVQLKGMDQCHFAAKATWESLSLITNRRIIRMESSGEIKELPLK